MIFEIGLRLKEIAAVVRIYGYKLEEVVGDKLEKDKPDLAPEISSTDNIYTTQDNNYC